MAINVKLQFVRNFDRTSPKITYNYSANLLKFQLNHIIITNHTTSQFCREYSCFITGHGQIIYHHEI